MTAMQQSHNAQAGTGGQSTCGFRARQEERAATDFNGLVEGLPASRRGILWQGWSCCCSRCYHCTAKDRQAINRGLRSRQGRPAGDASRQGCAGAPMQWHLVLAGRLPTKSNREV